MPPLSTNHELRNYTDAVAMYSEFQRSGWSAAASRSERICSQTSMPSALLAGALFIDKMIPDELHCILNETRVGNFFSFSSIFIYISLESTYKIYLST